ILTAQHTAQASATHSNKTTAQVAVSFCPVNESILMFGYKKIGLDSRLVKFNFHARSDEHNASIRGLLMLVTFCYTMGLKCFS
ncbi:MAG: hypothetical protein KAY26_01250, partial [Acinetobacter sp.]|nr:hypothetical protein [Acinetobacter sp.]